MSEATGRASVVEAGGKIHEVSFSIDLYKEAEKKRLSVPQLLQRKYGKNADKNYANGNVFAQMMASLGLPLDDEDVGFRSLTIGDIFDGSFGAAVTQDAKPGSNILAPAAILALVEENSQKDHSDTLSIFEKVIASNVTKPNKRFTRPIFDSSNADIQTISAIGQLATPNIVGQLMVSEKSFSIPTFSYGLEASDEALTEYTIDQVAIYLNRLRTELAYARVCGQLSSLVNGDSSTDMAPLPQTHISQYDSEAGGGKLTHKAYVKWLRRNWKYRRVDYVFCNEDDYFEIIYRKGRPTAITNPVDNTELLAHASKPVNVEFIEPYIFILDEGIIPAGTLVGIDSRYAIGRAKNSLANYQAVEDLVMRKGKQMRFDDAQIVYRLDDEAFKVTTLN